MLPQPLNHLLFRRVARISAYLKLKGDVSAPPFNSLLLLKHQGIGFISQVDGDHTIAIHYYFFTLFKVLGANTTVGSGHHHCKGVIATWGNIADSITML